MIFDYIAKVKENGAFDERRNGQARFWMYEAIDEQLRMRFLNAPGVADKLKYYEQLLMSGKVTSFAAAARMLGFYDGLKGDSNG